MKSAQFASRAIGNRPEHCVYVSTYLGRVGGAAQVAVDHSPASLAWLRRCDLNRRLASIGDCDLDRRPGNARNTSRVGDRPRCGRVRDAGRTLFHARLAVPGMSRRFRAAGDARDVGLSGTSVVYWRWWSGTSHDGSRAVWGVLPGCADGPGQRWWSRRVVRVHTRTARTDGAGAPGLGSACHGATFGGVTGHVRPGPGTWHSTAPDIRIDPAHQAVRLSDVTGIREPRLGVARHDDLSTARVFTRVVQKDAFSPCRHTSPCVMPSPSSA